MSSAYRTVAFAWLAAAACLGTGCGGSGASSAPPVSSSVRHTTSSGGGAKSIANAARAAAGHPLSSRAQYVAFARAINLRPDDVPGFVGKPKKREHDEGFRFRHCVKDIKGDLKESKSVFKASSKEFTAKGRLHFQSVSSEVEIARTRAGARRGFAAVRRILGDRASLRCFAQMVEAELRKYTGVRRAGKVTVNTAIGNVQITPLSLGATLAGSDGGLGLSVTMSVTYTVSGPVRSVKVPTSLEIDVLAFLVGRGAVTFQAMALGKPCSANLETRLFSQLVSRAVAAGRQFPEVGGLGHSRGGATAAGPFSS